MSLCREVVDFTRVERDRCGHRETQKLVAETGF